MGGEKKLTTDEEAVTGDDSPGAPEDDGLSVDAVVGPRSRWRHLRRRWLVLAAALVVLAGVGTWQGLSGSGAGGGVLTGRTGRSAPAFSLPQLGRPGAHLSLAGFRGRDLVVNFWASWCVPCRSEMPLLEAAYKADHAKVTFLGIAANDSPAAAHAFLAEVGVTYPAVSDASGTVALSYGVYGLPTTVFISPSGKILGRHVGQLHAASLREALKEAFGASL